MTRAREQVNATTIIRGLRNRVEKLERNGRDVITPVSTAAATVNQTAAQTPYMALVNPSGAVLTWWVLVTPTSGTTTTLQLRADDGAVGSPVTAPTSGANVVVVTMNVPPSWQVGDQHMIYLDAFIDVNSATVVPVRALIN